MSFIKDLGGVIGEAVGTVGGLAVAPIAIALGVSVEAVKKAIEAGCKTVDEIKDFLND